MKRKLLNKSKLLLLLALTFFSLTSMAQILVQVGTGTGSQGTQGATPYGTFYEDGKVTYLITKSELNALNVYAGKFGSLAFNVVTAPGQTLGGFTIKMAHTNATSLSGYVTAPFTTVYSAASVTATAGWNTYTFTNQFNYNNIDNVVIEVCFDNASYTSNGTVQSSTTTFNSVYGTYMDGGTGCASASLSFVTAANTNRPNMRINYFPNVSGNNIGVMSIDSPTTFCSNIQNVYATVGNFGVNQVTGFNVNWSVNGVLQTPIASTASIDTIGGANPSSLQILVGSYNFPSGANSLIKVWTSGPNFQTDTVNDNDTASATKTLSMSGVYTINGTPGPNNFSTIDSAILKLTASGVCGPIVFNIAPGTYTRTTPIVIGDILGASATNTITFDGGNALNTRYTGNIPSSGVFVLNSSRFVTVRNITIENTATTNPSAIAGVGATRNILIKKVVARVPIILTGTSSTGYGINFTGSANGNGISPCGANNNTIDSCRVVGGGYGIVSYGQSNTSSNSGLVFTNNIVDSNNYMGMYIAYNYRPVVIDNNTINMQGWNYGYYGMYLFSNQNSDTVVSHSLNGNKINNFGYYGIYAANPQGTITAAPIKITNNVISSFTGGSWSGFYGIYLQNLASGSRSDVYHNTVSMNGIQSSTISSAFYSTGSTVLNVKNNIFAVYSGSSTPAYFATAPVGNNINYNLYWNATNTTTGNLIYRGTFYNPTNYRTATVGGDSSYNENPSFVNRTANNFALTDGCNGFGFAGLVTNDINGNARSLTSPNVGAYEFAGGLANNLAVTRLLNPVSPITAGTQDLSFIVKNIGNNAVFSYNATYKLNNNTPVTQLMTTNTIAPCGVDTAVFTGTNQITLGAVNNITVYSSTPNSLTDADRTNDTLRAAYYTPLSGTYTVGGTNPDFATIAEAASVLSNGVSGPVVFDIRPGTYTGQVRVNGPIIGANDSNTVTFQGNDKNTRIINASVAGAPAFFINLASYVTVRNLTVNNTGTGNSSGIGVVGTNTASQGTKVNVINCNVNVPIQTGTSLTGYGIVYTGTAGATGLTAMRADSVLIDSNTVTGAGYSIVFFGASNSLYNRGNIFTNNTVNNSNYAGMYLLNQYNPVIVDNNTINMQGQNYGVYGLWFPNNQNGVAGVSSRLTRNRINNFGGYGIWCSASTSSVSAGTTLIANNIVNGNSTGISYPGYYGIYVTNTSTYPTNVFNNTVVMSGAGTSTTYSCLYSATSTLTNVRNNIFVVTNGSYTPAYFATNVTGNIVNYNQYWNATNTTTGNLVYRGGAFFNPTNYKTATVGGDSSFNVAPTFVGANNFALSNGCLRGVNLNGLVDNDIIGTLRATTPNLGAFEYQSTALDLQVEAMPYPQAPITLGSQNLAVRIRNNGGNTITSFDVAYRLNNGTPVVQNWTGTLASCDTVTVVFSGANQITLGASTNNVRVYTANPNSSVDGNPSNDTLVTILNPPMVGTYVIGNAPSDFSTIGAATAAIAGRGISGPVTFNIKSGVYNEQVTLAPAIGASAANTITFKSQANNVDSVSINSGNQFVVRFLNNANHYIFDRVTMNQTNNTTSGYTILVDNNANFDTIRNCKVRATTYDAATVTAFHYTLYTAAYVGDGLALLNNTFDGSYYGMRIYGASRTSYHRNTVVDNNVFNNFYYSPFWYMYYGVGSKVRNNVYNPFAGATTITSYMYFYYCDSGFVYTNNVWNGNTSRNLYMYTYYSNNAPSNKSIIGNNRIAGNLATYIYTGQSGTNNQDIVHNTFSTGNGYFYVGYASLQPSFRVLNNVFSATSTYAYYFSAAPSSALMTSDFNLVSSGSTTPYYATTARSLPNFRLTYPGLEGNSINYRAAINPTTLVPVANDTAVWAINGRGTHIGYSFNDVNNAVRPQTAAAGVPDLGAFEVTPTAIAPLADAIPTTPVAGGTQVFLFGTDTVAKITYDALATVPTAVGVRQYTGARHPQAGVTQNYTNVYADITATGNGGYLFDASLYYTNAQLGTNPSETNLKMARFNTIWNNYTGAASSVDTINNIIMAPGVTDFGSFLGTDDLNPLPVVLTKFVGKANNKNADLMWQTASEKNARLFEVHASVDGKNFKKVGAVKANGNTNVTSTYNFTDVNALANNNKVYYRLKSVDVDGTFEWSNTVIVTAKEANNASIDVYPNPFNNDVTVSLIDNTPATIEVVTLEGVNVYNATTNSNSSFANINLTQLTAGVYFIKVTQNGSTTVQKLVKQ